MPTKLLALVPAVLITGSASAQRVFLESFDKVSGDQGAFGVGSVYVVPVNGDMQGNAICLDMTFKEWGQDLGWKFEKGDLTGNTAAKLENYVLSFDLNLASAVAKTAVTRIRIVGWQEPDFHGARTATEEGQIKLPKPGTTQHYEVNLGTLLPAGDFDPRSASWQILINPKCWELGGPGSYAILIDNVGLTQVPSTPQK